MKLKPRTQTYIGSMCVFFALLTFSTLLLVWSYEFSIATIDKELKTAFSQRHATAQSIIETQMEIVNLSMREILDGPFLMEAVKNKEQARSTNLLITEMDMFAGYGNLDIIFISYPGYPVWADASFSLFDVAPLLADIARLNIPRSGMFYKAPSSDLILALKSIPIIHPASGKVMGIIFGGFVLNENLDLMELIRDKTQSAAVRFFSNGRHIGSTEVETSPLNEVLSNHYAGGNTDVISYGAGVISNHAPLIFDHTPTALEIMFAISDTSYVKLKTRYQYTILIMFILAVCLSILSAWILRRALSPSLHKLLAYSEMIRSGKTDAVYKRGHIIELNEVGEAMEAMVASLDQVNREKEELKNYLRHILDAMPSALVGINAGLQVTLWNRTAELNTGIPAREAHGKPLFKLIPWIGSENENLRESLRTGQILQKHKLPRAGTQGTRYNDVTIYPLHREETGAVIRIDDVTEKVKMEETIVQSEKMLSVGGLAAGMAHEINNPLAGMMQSANVVKNRLENTDMPANLKVAEELGISMDHIKKFMEKRDIFRMLDAIHKAGARAAEIVNNMLSFARKSDATISSHTPDQLMDESLKLAATDYDLKKQYDFKSIEIIKEYAEDLPMLPCEGAKIQQVLLNILSNGAQAMQAAKTKHPRFIIRIYKKESPDVVCMEIEDNGPGMDETTRSKIFDPFFTTKPAGLGTGLGLSVSYFIITENHKGTLAVFSEPGKGANFIIELPAHQKR